MNVCWVLLAVIASSTYIVEGLNRIIEWNWDGCVFLAMAAILFLAARQIVEASFGEFLRLLDPFDQ